MSDRVSTSRVSTLGKMKFFFRISTDYEEILQISVLLSVAFRFY